MTTTDFPSADSQAPVDPDSSLVVVTGASPHRVVQNQRVRDVVPQPATDVQIDAEADPAGGRVYLGVAGVFRAIARKLGPASAIRMGLVLLSNAAPLGPRSEGGSAGGDSDVARRDHRHPLPTGPQIEAVLDAHFGSQVWRSAHTELRTAVQIRDLLTTVLGPNWWAGGGGGGITLDQAVDGAGALLAGLGSFGYDPAANTLTFRLQEGAIPDGSIGSSKARAGTAEEKRGWRGLFGSSRISVGAALPAVAETNEGDIEVLSQDVAAGLAFRDVSDLATVLNAAATGDVLQVWTVRGVKTWVRLGNLIVGSRVAEAAAAAVSAALPPFFSIIPVPHGIAGGRNAADYPEAIAVIFSERQTSRRITGVSLLIGGAQLILDAGTPVSALNQSSQLLGLLRFNLAGFQGAQAVDARPALAQLVRDGTSQFLPGSLTISFDSGPVFTHDFPFPVQNPAFAERAWFSTPIGASPAVLPVGTRDVSVRFSHSGRTGYSRVPIEDLGAVALDAFVRLEGGDEAAARMTYTAATRTLVYSTVRKSPNNAGNVALRAIGEA